MKKLFILIAISLAACSSQEPTFSSTTDTTIVADTSIVLDTLLADTLVK